MMFVVEIFERQKRAVKWPVLRVRIKPHRVSTLQRQPNVVTKRMTRDAFAGNLRKAGVDLRRHLNRPVIFRLRLIRFIGTVIALVPLIAAVVVLITLVIGAFRSAVGI